MTRHADFYRQPHAPDPVLADPLVLDLTRRHVSDVDRVTGVDESGGEARAYLIDDTIVVKTQRPHRLRARTSLAKEAYLLDALASTLEGWIPRLLGYDKVDTEQGPVEYLCMTRIPGRANLGNPTSQALFTRLGWVLRRVHATPIDTQGLPADHDAAALRTRLENSFAGLAFDFPVVPLPLPLDKVIARALASLPDTLARPPMLLHSNPGPTHVFTGPGTGQFTGLIDFGDSYAGHPALDLHRWPNPADRLMLYHAYLDGTVPTLEFDQIWTIAMIHTDLAEIARASPHTGAARADLAVRLETL